jgi:hypothetical protein
MCWCCTVLVCVCWHACVLYCCKSSSSTLAENMQRHPTPACKAAHSCVLCAQRVMALHEFHHTRVLGLARAPLHPTGIITIVTTVSEPVLPHVLNFIKDINHIEHASMAIVITSFEALLHQDGQRCGDKVKRISAPALAYCMKGMQMSFLGCSVALTPRRGRCRVGQTA